MRWLMLLAILVSSCTEPVECVVFCKVGAILRLAALSLDSGGATKH